jgi:hypothetical protein
METFLDGKEELLLASAIQAWVRARCFCAVAITANGYKYDAARAST